MAATVRWYGQIVSMRTMAALSHAVESLAVNIWSDAKRICPVRTGRLRNSIRIVKGAGSKPGWVRYSVIAGRGGKSSGVRLLGRTAGAGNYEFTNRITGTAEQRPDAYYAIYVELGTRYMTAKPFMRPAFNKHRYKFRAAVRRALRSRGI